MYSSCKEAHIAVSDKIQQINANRQQSIRPQYIDIALNEAIDVLLTQKIKAYEETGRYYDDLQVLKTTVTSPLYLCEDEENRGFTFIPANYLHNVAFIADVIFDKFRRYRAVKNVMERLCVIDISNLYDNLPNIRSFTIVIDGNGFTIDYPAKIYKKEGLFDYINYMLPKFYNGGYNAYYEYLDGIHFPDSLVFRFDHDPNIIVANGFNVNRLTKYYKAYTGSYTEITSDGEVGLTKATKKAGMDLVSDVERMDLLQTYHNKKNRHIHPICTLGSNRLFVDMDDTFVIPKVTMVYLRKPTYFNIVDNVATELPFTTEIINLAVQKLLGKLKDDAYQIAVNENYSLK